MANSAALIRESIWRDRDFRSLPRGAQATYVQLCSQKDLDCAGLLTLNVGLLAKGCDQIDKAAILADLAVLEDHRFVFVDDETDELFIRSYMRTAQVVKSPNIFKSALKSAGMVESDKLRAEVAAELRRLHRAEADKLADELNPSGSHRPDPTKGSGTLPENGTLPEPSSTGTGLGLGSPSVGGYLGEGTAPRPHCPKHVENHDGPCRPCEARRKWDLQHEADVKADELHRKRTIRALIDACPDCDQVGRLDDLSDCPKHPSNRKGAESA
ncbi:hypothetical protein [Mycolicibacterium bacteremicum]|uniref:hypothetical protein n=1 Tax=Mycolicibacterium bacteremicum TaxID=564198 RepID=UPI001055B686|nr:hypothetical protein [Mycolicibacterium bacteremicum]MCV7434838.1 hypothetical protein [Mycolicibacterium bacteremicum]